MPRTPRPWFRLYSDILDNLKLEDLPPPLFRYWVKLMALANVSTPRGLLPPTRQVAFRLRVKEGAALEGIERLMVAGLVDATPDGYVMHDWDDWQADRDVSVTNRGGRRDENHANVTDTSRIRHGASVKTRGERGEEKKEGEERRGEGDPADAVCADFARFGKLTAGTAQAITYAVKDYGLEWTQRAVRDASGAGFDGKPPWSYVEEILERWKKQGHPDEPKPSNGHRTQTTRGTAPERDYAGAADRIEARLAKP